jgi:hypothetical protein
MSVSLVQLDALECDFPGCSSRYEHSLPGCAYSAETRAEAKAAGWTVNMKSGRRLPGRSRVPREDWCPLHKKPSKATTAQLAAIRESVR